MSHQQIGEMAPSWRQQQREYAAQLPELGRYRAMLEALVRDLVSRDPARLPIHDVHSRVKTWQSCFDKCQGAWPKYASYSELHDLVGVRVVVYFDDHTKEVARILSASGCQFDVLSDDVRHKDGRPYTARHLTLALGETRKRLPEYGPLSHQPFELQIRTLLAHAWSEIEHDRGYKALQATGTASGPEVTAQFRELGIILQNADTQFCALRDKVDAERTAALAADDTPLNANTLLSLFDGEPCSELDKRIAERIGTAVDGDCGAKGLVNGTRRIGIRTTGALRAGLRKQRSRLLEFAAAARSGSGPMRRGSCVMYLVWLVLLDEGRKEDVLEHMKAISADNAQAEQWLVKACELHEGLPSSG